jgi:integrase
VDTWLQVRLAGASEAKGTLFLPLNKGGRMMMRRLNNQAVMDILLKRAKQATIKNVSPHDFRRTFISDMLDAGVDTITV